MTPEEREAKNARRRKMTPEQRAAKNAAQREYSRLKRSTPEGRAAVNSYQRDWLNHHPDTRVRMAELTRRWKQAHPERVLQCKREYAARRRANQRNGKSNIVATNEALQSLLGKNNLYATAAKAVRPGYSRDDRDEIIHRVILAMLEGETDIAKAAKRAATDHFGPTSRFLSLNAPIPGMDGLTYIDRLDSDALHF